MILKLDISKEIGYTYFNGSKVLQGANRESKEKRESYSGLAWRKTAKRINER